MEGGAGHRGGAIDEGQYKMQFDSDKRMGSFLPCRFLQSSNICNFEKNRSQAVPSPIGRRGMLPVQAHRHEGAQEGGVEAPDARDGVFHRVLWVHSAPHALNNLIAAYANNMFVRRLEKQAQTRCTRIAMQCLFLGSGHLRTFSLEPACISGTEEGSPQDV